MKVNGNSHGLPSDYGNGSGIGQGGKSVPKQTLGGPPGMTPRERSASMPQQQRSGTLPSLPRRHTMSELPPEGAQVKRTSKAAMDAIPTLDPSAAPGAAGRAARAAEYKGVNMSWKELKTAWKDAFTTATDKLTKKYDEMAWSLIQRLPSSTPKGRKTWD